MEAKKINAIFSKEPSKMYSQLQCIKMVIKIEPITEETMQYWKNI